MSAIVAKIKNPTFWIVAATTSVNWSSVSAQTPINIKGSGIQVVADSMERDGRAEKIFLQGNVQLLFKGNHLSANEAVIDLKKKTFVASGNVILTNLKTHSEAQEIEYSYDQGRGVMHNGFVQSGSVIFEGERIDKINEDDYIVTNAKYTACTTCPPAWSFSGRRIKARMGGYARISQPLLRVGGVPVFWFPGLIVPLKSKRQSGLLSPSLRYSNRGGAAISQDLFLVINKSQDLTLTLAHHEKLGIKTSLEYRYILTENSRGVFHGAHLKDRAFKSEHFVAKEFDRWYTDYTHQYELPENFIHRLDIHSASDLRYAKDFPVDLPFNGDPALENKTSITKNSPLQHFSVQATHFRNLLKASPLAENNDAVHKMPEFQHAFLETRILGTGLLFKSNFSYVNFARSGFSYDEVTTETNSTDPCQPLSESFTPEKCVTKRRDGLFNISADGQTRDILRTGSRLDFSPQISYPFLLNSKFSLTPSALYRETQYQFDLGSPIDNRKDNYGSTASRRYLQTDLVGKTRFSRVYAKGTANENRIKHEMEPEIGYSKIPWIRRPNHGFFGNFEDQPYSQTFRPISDKDVFGNNRLQFDYHDRVFDKDLVTFQLTNKLVRKKATLNDHGDYKNIALFRLAQSYDLTESRRKTPQPWSDIQGLLDVRLDHFETYTEANYFPYAKVTNISSRIKLLNDKMDFIQVSYLQSVLINESNQQEAQSQTQNFGLGAGISGKYLDLTGQIDYSNITYKIQGWMLDTFIKPPGDCWGIKATATQTVAGPLEFRFNFAFNYGGNPVL